MASPLTRRRWLKRTLLTGAGVASPHLWLPRLSGQEPANERLQVALIGLGKQGLAHLETLLTRPDVHIVALADVDQAHLNAAKRMVDATYQSGDVKVYEDFRDLLSASNIDLAVLSVPNHWHALIGIACAEAGIDIYGETPLAHSIVEGRALCDAVTRYGRVWQTGNALRSNALFQRACGLVTSGRLGVTRTVEVGTYGGLVDLTGKSKGSFFQDADGFNYDLWLGPAAWIPYHPGRTHQNWRWHQAFGGGQLMAWAGKYIDIALWGLGLDNGGPIQVEANGEFVDHPIYNVPVKYDAEASFSNDLTMRVSSSLAPGIRWHGDEGWIYVSEKKLLASSPDLLRSDTADAWAMAKFNERGQDHWQDFIDSVRTRRPTVAPIESAQRAATIGHLCMLSLNTGRPISWRPRTETVFEDPQVASLLEIPYRQPWMLHE